MNNDKDKKNVCVICGKEYTEYPNNAEPVRKGECCDNCNYGIVVPERIARYEKSKK